MDWAVFSMLGATAKDIKTLTFSYDICCAWSVHFWQRLKDLYDNIYQIPKDLQITFVIPKFHLEAHGEDCKASFNLNHTTGAARTCGEGIETGWADTNPAALSTREMSLTYRREVLDDLFGAINWRKIKTMGAMKCFFKFSILLHLSLGAQLLHTLRDAIPMARKHARRFKQMSEMVPKPVLTSWNNQIRDWDRLESKKKNAKNSPYRDPANCKFHYLF